MSRWWGAGADRGDTDRLEAFSDEVLAIAITLLILDVRVEVPAGTSLAEALGHALPQIGAYAASFLQIGIIWANHHALFRVVNRVDQLMLLLNLLLGLVSSVPLPTRLVAGRGENRTRIRRQRALAQLTALLGYAYGRSARHASGRTTRH